MTTSPEPRRWIRLAKATIVILAMIICTPFVLMFAFAERR